MKLVKRLLLGSAAGLTTVGGVQAADLPVRKAAPVEYVRVCSAEGSGFFYIPGTDTCLRVGGRARFEYQYAETRNRNGANGDVSGYRALGRLNIDARTSTAYGTLRTFVRFDIATRTGAYLTSGSGQRRADSFPALGQDTFGRAQKFVDVDKAFIQFAGFTAGRAQSFFDFYAHDFEMHAATSGSDANTNLAAYTATFGNGFSATVSMEDPTYRRSAILSNAFAGNLLGQTAFNVFTNNVAVSPVAATFDVNGNPSSVTFYDVTQKNRMPDFVGALRYDAPWGSAQISAAVHEINIGSGNNTFAAVNGSGVVATTVGLPRAQNEYGWAVQGGLKVNTPFIAAGDALYLQGAYGEGALKYTGAMDEVASDIVSAGLINGSPFPLYLTDAVLNPITRRLTLSQSFSVSASYLHYWAPEWRSAFFGSYGEINQGKGARNALALTNFGLSQVVGGITPAAAAVNATSNAFSPFLRDVNLIVAGASLIWSPVRDLDIGVEGIYQRAALNNGRTNDANKNPAGLAVNGVPVVTTNSYDNFLVRFRVQRDF